MKDYTISQQLALIGLEGQDSHRMTMAKAAVLRGVKVAQHLEALLAKSEAEPEAKSEAKLESEAESTSKPEASAPLLSALKKEVAKIKSLWRRSLRAVEKEITRPLLLNGDLEEVPDLLGCDMDYATSGIDIKTYRAQEEVYRRVSEGLRAEILEEGPVTVECFCLLWLLRECYCIHDLFSVTEQRTVNSRMISAAAENPLYSGIMGLEFYSGPERLFNKWLKFKSDLFKHPQLEGINLLFPFLERRKSIFIDYVVLGSTVSERRLSALLYISERGHYVEEVPFGEEVLLKIDNSFYRIFPSTRVYKLPVQGYVLLPAYM